MSSKSGITMVTIVMYVVIFFALTALATGVTMAMNSNSLQDKGKIYVEEAEMKLKSNILHSVENSTNFEIINGNLVFSNDDIYYYDDENRVIYKNGGILIQNVNYMNYSISDVIKEHVYNLQLEFELEKYGQSKAVTASFVKSGVEF